MPGSGLQRGERGSVVAPAESGQVTDDERGSI
jgi:hypothetical protein